MKTNKNPEILDFLMKFPTLICHVQAAWATRRVPKIVDMAGSGDIKLRVLDFGFAVFNMFLAVFCEKICLKSRQILGSSE
ncbi:hypothetical protein [Undibacterium sp. WLHG33]|uniref:hypothetical protein n=1 Tax=Undibacterium sp. WLHG33 TaxID=3412482 RepID=UPI003C2C7D12